MPLKSGATSCFFGAIQLSLKAERSLNDGRRTFGSAIRSECCGHTRIVPPPLVSARCAANLRAVFLAGVRTSGVHLCQRLAPQRLVGAPAANGGKTSATP